MSSSTSKSGRKGCFIFIIAFFVCVSLVGTGVLFLIGSAIGGASDMVGQELGSSFSRKGYDETTLVDNKAEFKVVVIPIDQVITSMGGYSDNIIHQLRIASEDAEVKAVILSFNTPGGEVIATDEIHHEIQKLRAKGLPVISQMRSIATSGGYYLAAGTDYIVANRLTMTGSIGVIISSYNMHGLFDRLGIRSQVFKSGAMKDALSASADPDTPERAAQNVIIEKMVMESFEEFALIVADGRKLPIEKVKGEGIGDARIMSGREARDKGLVDELGYFEDALREAIKRSGVKELNVVTFSRKMGFAEFLLHMDTSTEGRLVERAFSEGFLLSPGKAYYLAPGAY